MGRKTPLAQGKTVGICFSEDAPKVFLLPEGLIPVLDRDGRPRSGPCSSAGSLLHIPGRIPAIGDRDKTWDGWTGKIPGEGGDPALGSQPGVEHSRPVPTRETCLARGGFCLKKGNY